MKKKFCVTCGEETWHNPRAATDKSAPEPRCTKCGNPRSSVIGKANTGTKLPPSQYPY